MEFKESSIWNLTLKQQEAWKNLKKAFKDCDKSGIYIVNSFGTLFAFRSDYIAGYEDSLQFNYDEDNTIELYNEKNIPKITPKNNLVSWADDSHHVILTEKGKNIYLSELEKEDNDGNRV